MKKMSRDVKLCSKLVLVFLFSITFAHILTVFVDTAFLLLDFDEQFKGNHSSSF